MNSVAATYYKIEDIIIADEPTNNLDLFNQEVLTETLEKYTGTLIDGEWAIMEWKDPLGLRGCGFFHFKDDLIVYQRGCAIGVHMFLTIRHYGVEVITTPVYEGLDMRQKSSAGLYLYCKIRRI